MRSIDKLFEMLSGIKSEYVFSSNTYLPVDEGIVFSLTDSLLTIVKEIKLLDSKLLSISNDIYIKSSICDNEDSVFKYKGQSFKTVEDMFNYASEYLNAELSEDSISLACEEMALRIWNIVKTKDVYIKNKLFLKIIEDLTLDLVKKIYENEENEIK